MFGFHMPPQPVQDVPKTVAAATPEPELPSKRYFGRGGGSTEALNAAFGHLAERSPMLGRTGKALVNMISPTAGLVEQLVVPPDPVGDAAAAQARKEIAAQRRCVTSEARKAEEYCMAGLLPNGRPMPSNMRAAQCMSMWAEGYGGGSMTMGVNDSTARTDTVFGYGGTAEFSAGGAPLPQAKVQVAKPSNSEATMVTEGTTRATTVNRDGFEGYNKRCFVEAAGKVK